MLALVAGCAVLAAATFSVRGWISGNGRVTRENFARLTAGMTKAEVNGILGNGQPAGEADMKRALQSASVPFNAAREWLVTARRLNAGDWQFWRNGGKYIFIAHDNAGAVGMSVWVDEGFEVGVIAGN